MTETQVRAHVTARLDGLVAVLGEEVAAVEKKIRSDLNVELAELRAQVTSCATASAARGYRPS